MNELICEKCFPKAVEIGKIGDDIWLFENEGIYGLMGKDGHKDEEYLIFPDKPIPDPDPECNDPEKEEVLDAWLDMMERLDEKMKMSPYDGFMLVINCKKAGWRTKTEEYSHGFLTAWLFDYCGKLIDIYERSKLLQEFEDLSVSIKEKLDKQSKEINNDSRRID